MLVFPILAFLGIPCCDFVVKFFFYLSLSFPFSSFSRITTDLFTTLELQIRLSTHLNYIKFSSRGFRGSEIAKGSVGMYAFLANEPHNVFLFFTTEASEKRKKEKEKMKMLFPFF